MSIGRGRRGKSCKVRLQRHRIHQSKVPRSPDMLPCFLSCPLSALILYSFICCVFMFMSISPFYPRHDLCLRVGWEEGPNPLLENTPGKRRVKGVFSGVAWAPDLSEGPKEIIHAVSLNIPRAHIHIHTRYSCGPQVCTRPKKPASGISPLPPALGRGLGWVFTPSGQPCFVAFPTPLILFPRLKDTGCSIQPLGVGRSLNTHLPGS